MTKEARRSAEKAKMKTEVLVYLDIPVGMNAHMDILSGSIEKRPPVLSRIASGMRKSLTNLFSIFSSGVRV